MLSFKRRQEDISPADGRGAAKDTLPARKMHSLAGCMYLWYRCDVGMQINIELVQRFTGGRAHCGLWEEGKTSLVR